MTLSNRATARQTATSVPNAAALTPLEKLREFLETHAMNGKTGPRAFADFERDLHARLMEVERDVIAAEMKKFDDDDDAVVIEGKLIAACCGRRRRT